MQTAGVYRIIVCYLSIFQHSNSTIHNLSNRFRIPKLKFCVFPKTPNICNKKLFAIRRQIMQQLKHGLDCCHNVLKRLLNHLPKAARLPNLHCEWTIKKHMMQIFRTNLTRKTIQRTMHPFILESNTRRKTTTTNTPD